jgi:ribosomal protein S18 acetylase RimI-like enzyme
MKAEHLDNPVWYALNGVQQQFAIGAAHAKRFQPHILPFIGCDTASAIDTIDPYILQGEMFYFIGELPALPSRWKITKELACAQMVLQKPVPSSGPVTALNASHSEDMFNLINKVQPGFYKPDTRFLGDYYGVWQDGKLVAMAGERIQVDNFTELSAICTDPAYTGRHYAQHLITALCNSNLSKGKTPFLHVLATTERAVRLYEYMGFTQRRLISFWQITKQ